MNKNPDVKKVSKGRGNPGTFADLLKAQGKQEFLDEHANRKTEELIKEIRTELRTRMFARLWMMQSHGFYRGW
ncbi:MAG: hypothetical protein LBJ73_04240 [Rickettsiales bacterium]|jgi:hypothetical protein|nr:hypothetical protein [Rickettsiales bacterium]